MAEIRTEDIRLKKLTFEPKDIDSLRAYNEKIVLSGKAVGELDVSTHHVSLLNASHIIRSMTFGDGVIDMQVEILGTSNGGVLKLVFDYVDFKPIFNLDNDVLAINAFNRQYDGIFFPHQFHKFPFNKVHHWNIHRMSEHHNKPAWMQGFDKSTFIIHGHDVFGFEKDAIFIVPESIQRIFEILLNRGRIEQGKTDAEAIQSVMKFMHADPISGIFRTQK